MTDGSGRRRAVTVVVAVAWVLAVVAAVASCGGGTGATGGGAAADASGCGRAPRPRALVPQVVREVPHDPGAFTQGLVVVDGTLYESTGLVGRSGVRAVDASTGEVLAETLLEGDRFGEGLAASGADGLVQVTWTDGEAVRWRRPADPSVPPVATGRWRYDGEGWGLTTLDDGTFAMSDGSDVVTERDGGDFAVLGRWQVRRRDGGTDRLNELEWDGGRLWANRWQTDEILRIDRRCRVVTGVVDAAALSARARELAGDAPIDVLNGIAHLPGTDRFLVTGKLWPVLFEVRFAPA